MSKEADSSDLAWYALKVFFNRIGSVAQSIEDSGLEVFVPMQTKAVTGKDGKHELKRVPLVQSLLFFKAPTSALPSLIKSLDGSAMVYSKPGLPRTPAAIPQDQMDIFRIVTGNSEGSLEYLGDDTRRYSVGERVRVTGGPLCGAEGHICRIRGDKRLVVSISGVCAVATSYIPACLLQKINNSEL